MTQATDDERSGQGLASSGLRVFLVTPFEGVPTETFIRNHAEHLPAEVEVLYTASVKAFRSDEDMQAEPWWVTSALGWVHRALVRVLQVLHVGRAVTRALARGRHDVVLAEYGTTAVKIMDACRWAGVPLVAHFHGYDAYSQEALLREGKLYPRLFETARRIVVVSRHMEEQLVKLGAPPERIRRIPYGVDLDAFQQGAPASAPPTFLAVGRFVDKKAPHLTILAFAEVHAAFPQARLRMTGAGPLEESCRQLVASLGLDQVVEFLGEVEHAAVPELMQGARAFVQHSVQTSYGDSEGTPVAVLEASATGLPVAATRHAGIADAVVHEETGLLVDEGDMRGMARAMLRLAEDPDLAARLGQRGRDRMQALYPRHRQLEQLSAILAEAAQA